MRFPALLTQAAILAPTPVSAQAGADLFTPDVGLGIWTILVFLVVLVVLRRFAWNPILGGLNARESEIRDSIEEARRLRGEAQVLIEEHRKELADARRQSQEILAAGRDAGERIRREIEAKAREEADHIVDRARVEIERQRDQALEVLRKEAVELALFAAAKLLQRRLDTEADRQLVEGYLRELDPAEADPAAVDRSLAEA